MKPMTNSPLTPQEPSAAASPIAVEPAAARRALLVSDSEATTELEDRLAAAGLTVSRAAAREALRAVKELEPSLILLAFGGRESESGFVTLARRLRTDFSTLAVPVVFLFREDGRTLRSAAQHFGADDYFAQDAPAEEIRARLASLFWRVEAGRRAAPALAEQRDEIDNFIFLLDAVAADAKQGLTGTIALIEAAGSGASGSLLRKAHAFLKLNLRRADAVAFYGPTTLVAYLPGADASAARATLVRLREEFRATRPGSDLLAGLAAFPADGAEVEALVERGEVALAAARSASDIGRIQVYGADPAAGPAHAMTLETGQETRRGATGASAAELMMRETTAGVGQMSGAASEASPDTIVPSQTLREPSAGSQTERKATGGDATRAASQASREAMVETPTPEEFRPRRSTLRRLMLVISDAARMAQVNLLMRSASYEVRAAFDGNHALNLLRIDTPDVLLLDYDLHGMSGAEMLRRLRQQVGAGRLPPAVVLVAPGRDDARREVTEAGARAVVELPYDPVELLDTLSAADRGEE
jgi:DNA-binding response OmpR family regulator